MAKVSSTTMAVRVSCFLPRLLLRTFVLPRASLLRAYTLILWVGVRGKREREGREAFYGLCSGIKRSSRSKLSSARSRARFDLCVRTLSIYIKYSIFRAFSW